MRIHKEVTAKYGPRTHATSDLLEVQYYEPTKNHSVHYTRASVIWLYLEVP